MDEKEVGRSHSTSFKTATATATEASAEAWRCVRVGFRTLRVRGRVRVRGRGRVRRGVDEAPRLNGKVMRVWQVITKEDPALWTRSSSVGSALHFASATR